MLDEAGQARYYKKKSGIYKKGFRTLYSETKNTFFVSSS
jgi:hypothetical protein